MGAERNPLLDFVQLGAGALAERALGASNAANKYFETVSEGLSKQLEDGEYGKSVEIAVNQGDDIDAVKDQLLQIANESQTEAAASFQEEGEWMGEER
eukprot:1643461-Pyramimonas_sp.AAC.1